MIEPRTKMAAANNADLYAAMFDAHGISYARDGHSFTAHATPPPYYSHLTCQSDDTAELHDRIATLQAAHPKGIGIKDSFDQLSPANMVPLFSASWIWRAPQPAHSDWTRITTANALAHWETMWKAAESLTDHTMFPPALLDDTKFAVLQSDDKLSGCIVNLSDDCAGLSNVFGPAPFADATRAAAAMAGDLPLVGYESGSQLDAATAAGFVQTGTLHILVSVR